MTLEQELHSTANYETRLFREKMLYLYSIEFDKAETEEIEDLLINFYEKMKTISLGYYKTEEKAAKAYDNAAKIYHGEFANLNFKDKT